MKQNPLFIYRDHNQSYSSEKLFHTLPAQKILLNLTRFLDTDIKCRLKLDFISFILLYWATPSKCLHEITRRLWKQ